ncbi:Putative LOC101234561, partial [Caligus rogercresseyi]
SDPIEKRFGWYRQLSGGNYYISVRQILEAEKKIRVLSLVKFSNMTISNITELMDDDAEGDILSLTGRLWSWRLSQPLERVVPCSSLPDTFLIHSRKKFSANRAKHL